MSDDERRRDDSLTDIKTLLADPKTFKVTEGTADLVRFGERIFQRIQPEDVLSLDSWHPDLKKEFMASVKLEFPAKYEALTLAFRGSRHPGWRWDINSDLEILSEDQARLSYAVAMSLVSLTLDGIVLRTYGLDHDKRNTDRLGEILTGIVEEEMLLDTESRQLEAVRLNDDEAAGEEKQDKEKRELHFAVYKGVKIMESLPNIFT